MKLTEIMKIASSAYPDDLIMRYHKNPKHDFGDTLAKFLAVEIKDTYDADEPAGEQLLYAARKVDTAIQELAKVRERLQNAGLDVLHDQTVPQG